MPGTTVDRQCGSSQQAIHFAVQAVASGTQDCVIAGGVEVMSLVPIGASVRDGLKAGHGVPNGEAIQDKYGVPAFSQFHGAELLAEKYDISRAEMEDLAFSSHQRAAAATKAGRFADEVVSVEGHARDGAAVQHNTDEGTSPRDFLHRALGSFLRVDHTSLSNPCLAQGCVPQ